MMCEEALIALPQGGFGGMGGSTGVQAGLTARHHRKRMAALRLPRVKVTGAEGGWRTRPRYLQKKSNNRRGGGEEAEGGGAEAQGGGAKTEGGGGAEAQGGGAGEGQEGCRGACSGSGT